MKLRKMNLPSIVGIPLLLMQIPASVSTEALRLWKSLNRQRDHSAAAASFISFRLSIGIGLCMLAAIAMSMSSSFVAGHRKLSDPFSVVSDFFNGDIRQMALAHGFTCQNPDYPATRSDFCWQLNPDPMYSGIYLDISDGNMTEVSLTLRENTLTLGDLILLWGKPKTSLYCETNVANWFTHQFTAKVGISRTLQTDYFAPILMITFIREGWAYWELPLVKDVLHGC